MALIQEWDQVTELNQLELFLRQPDAVMEPNIMEKATSVCCQGWQSPGRCRDADR